jgi:hypothetical protein
MKRGSRLSPSYGGGPFVPRLRRQSQMAWVMARMCASVKVPSSGVPRCPLVPKRTGWLRSLTSGRRSIYSRSSRAASISSSLGAGLPARGESVIGSASSHDTGQGAAPQMPAPYSAMVRSLENLPEPAALRIARRAYASGSAYSSQRRRSASRYGRRSARCM